MLISLKKLLIYAGLEPKEFEAIRSRVLEVNGKNLHTYSLLAAVIFTLLAFASFLTSSYSDVNLITYSALAGYNLVLYFVTCTLLPRHPSYTQGTAYLFMAGLYVFSLVVSALHPEFPAASALVMLFAVPFFLYDRPVRMITMTVIVSACLCIVATLFKAPDIARADIWNAVSFGVVAIILESLLQCDKFKSLFHEQTVVYMSQTDLLTGAKNRNHFENHANVYADRCTDNLICVYVDANGLHELNNRAGHAAGDQLLIAVAKALIDAFGASRTYRVGGDEFVCFDMDTKEEYVREQMTKAKHTLEDQGYSISWGIASAAKDQINMEELMRRAEAEMYSAKRDYYHKTEHDRRRRSSD